MAKKKAKKQKQQAKRPDAQYVGKGDKKRVKKERSIDRAVSRGEARDEAKAQKEVNRWYKPDGETLGRLGSYDKIAGLKDPEQVQGLGDYGRVSTADPNADKTLASREQEYEQSKQRDPNMQNALDRMASGLEGFNSEQQQALMNQGLQGIKQDTATAQRNLRSAASQGGVTGSSALRAQQGVLKDAAKQRANLRSNMIAQNAVEQSNRLNAYGAYANTAYGTQQQARQNALDRLSGDRTQQQQMRIAADTQNQNMGYQYAKAGQDAQMYNADNAYRTGLANQANDMYNQKFQRETDTYNIEQGEKELAGKQAVYYGEQGVRQERTDKEKAQRLAEEEEELANQGF